MARPSSIDRLPPDVRKALDRWIYDPAVTQAEATARVNTLLAEVAPAHPGISKSAVNRYDLSVRKVQDSIRRSREIARLVIADVGSTPSGEVGQMITEMIKTMILEVNLKLQDQELTADSLPGMTRNLRELSLAIERLQRAEKINEERESEVRRRAAEELAAKAADEAGPGGSVTGDRLREIAREIYGVR